MGVSYIPGPEAILGPALAQVAGSVGDIIKPNSRFQQAFQRELSTRPELLQQLVDLESQSPGVVSKQFAPIIGEELATVISSMTPSLNAQKANLVRDALPSIANVPIEMLPEVARTPAQVAAVQTLTGATTDQLTIEREQASQATRAAKQRVAAQRWWNNLSQEQKEGMVGPYGGLDDLLADPNFLQRLAIDWADQQARRADDVYRFMQERRIIDATRWLDTTKVGSIDDWLFFFSDKGRKRLNALQTGTAAGPDDAPLLAVAAAFGNAPRRDRLKDVNIVVDNLNQTLPKIRNAQDEGERAALIASMNQQLADLGSGFQLQYTSASKAGGKEKPGIVRMIPGVRGREVRFYDREGNEVTQADLVKGLFGGVPAGTSNAGAGAGAGNSGSAGGVPNNNFSQASLRARYWQAEGQRQGLTGDSLNNYIRSKLRAEGINVQ